VYVGEYSPGEVLHVDVDLTIAHTREGLSSSFETTDSPSVPLRSIRNSLHGRWLSMLPSFQTLHQICDGLQCHKNVLYIKNLIYTSPVDSDEER